MAWYEIWRTSPQAKTFVMTDWMRLRMIAPLLEDYLNKPTAMKMAEIRQNESLLGATHELGQSAKELRENPRKYLRMRMKMF